MESNENWNFRVALLYFLCIPCAAQEFVPASIYREIVQP